MAKASLKLPNGTVVTLEGVPEEVKRPRFWLVFAAHPFSLWILFRLSETHPGMAALTAVCILATAWRFVYLNWALVAGEAAT
jgi:hypothetical protein